MTKRQDLYNGWGNWSGCVQYYQDKAGEWRWRLRACNNRIIANSGKGYKTERGAFSAFDRVQMMLS